MNSINEQLNSLFEGYFGVATRDNGPEYSIKDGKIRLDLLGAKKENISLTKKGSVLTIVATKKNIHGQSTKFERQFQLTEGYDPDTIKASYEEGILEITVDQYEKEKETTIKIS